MIDKTRVDDLMERARREVDDLLLPACQVALAYEGELVAFETFGDATPTTRFCVFSATKAFVASAAWILIGEGKLDVSRKVADVIPEFGTNGKDVVTIEQVMLHTSGFPRAPLGPPAWGDREQRLEAFAKWRLNWEPGTAFEYHPTSAHWVLAELIERLGGADYRTFIRERVIEPLGLSLGLGIAEDDPGEFATITHVGDPPDPEELQRLFGVPELPVTEVTEVALELFNEPANRAVGVPGGGAFGTAADLALFYQALLTNDAGIWDGAVLGDATGTIRNNFTDPWVGVPASRALGVIVANSDGKGHMRGFGKTGSRRLFGHPGAGGQQGWGDPETGISFGYVTNGMDRNVLRQARRDIAVASRAAECASAAN